MLRFVSLLFAAVFGAAFAQPTTAPATPTRIDGAETFVYRDGKPEPMRLFVFKPKAWKADDHRPALMYFFDGAWAHGTPEKSAAWARQAARWGMVGIAPDYRTLERFGTTPLQSVADARASLDLRTAGRTHSTG